LCSENDRIGEINYRRRGIYNGDERGGTDVCPNLKNSGTLSPGYDADVTCFDPQTVRDTVAFQASISRPGNIIHMLINGVPVLRNSQFRHHSPGRPLKTGALGITSLEM